MATKEPKATVERVFVLRISNELYDEGEDCYFMSREQIQDLIGVLQDSLAE